MMTTTSESALGVTRTALKRALGAALILLPASGPPAFAAAATQTHSAPVYSAPVYSAPVYSAPVYSAPVRSAPWWVDRLGMADVWRITRGAGVLVAVIDSGIRADRPEFRGAVVPGADLASGGTDGRVDTDPKSHGTRMAMLIAARGDSVTGMVGIAPGVQVLPITLGVAGSFHDAGGFGSAAAIRWAVDHGASVVNMSYASPSAGRCPSALQDAILHALDHNVVLVAAAGNDGSDINQPEIPALCPGVIGVGAVDEQGRPWMDTERQSYLDLAGPGVGITSIDKRGMSSRADGTSDAAALVSGAVALLRARFPRLPARQIVTRLLATAKDAGAPGRDDQTGYGIVRPLNALTEDVPADAPNPVYEEVDRLRGGAGASVPVASARRVGTGNLPLAVGAGAATAGLTALVTLLQVRRRRPSRSAGGG